MNILLGIISLILGVGITGGIFKLCELILPKVFSKIIFEPTNDSRVSFYLNKIRNCVVFSIWVLVLFYSSHIISLYLISNEFNFWITVFKIGILVTIILCIWIIIQYLGDLFYEHGLKGIGDKSIKNINKFFRVYWRIFGICFFSWLFILPISDTHLGLADNIYNNLFVISYYGFFGMFFLVLGLVGLEIRVESNIEERIRRVRTNDDMLN